VARDRLLQGDLRLQPVRHAATGRPREGDAAGRNRQPLLERQRRRTVLSACADAVGDRSARFGRSPLTWVALALCAYAFDIYASIVFGVLAATLHRRFPDFHLRRLSRIALAGILIASTPWLFADHAYRYAAPWAAIAIVLLLAIRGTKHPFGTLAGGLSYPLYLNHWIGGFTATVLLIPLGLRQSPVHPVLSVLLAIGFGRRALLVDGTSAAGASPADSYAAARQDHHRDRVHDDHRRRDGRHPPRRVTTRLRPTLSLAGSSRSSDRP
jgi:hypothetical protein